MKNKHSILLSCLIAITIVSLIFDEYIYENIKIARFLKQIGNLLWLVTVYFIGRIGWNAYKLDWIKQLWNFSYLTFLLILILLGMVDFIIGGFAENIKEAIGYTRFFFTSPVPFAISWLLVYKSRS